MTAIDSDVARRGDEWTLDDLAALPSDKRFEIIGGELFELPTPWMVHAATIMNLFTVLHDPVKASGGKMLVGPVSVSMDGAALVLPDFIVYFPDRFQFITKRAFEGPPNLIIEVLDHWNPEHDRLRKRALYARAGVLEYWLVSPEAGIVEVLTLDGEQYRTHVRAGGDEMVTSVLLPEVSFAASAVFVV